MLQLVLCATSFTILIAILALSQGSLIASVKLGVQQNVRLVLTTTNLEPATTFEVRFDKPVVATDFVGTEASGPLLFEPKVKGDFLWLSRRSGIFTPLEPLRLGTAYRLSLRDGLTDAGGAPLDARLDIVLQTPDFAPVDFSRHGYYSIQDLPPRPEIDVSFNGAVDPARVAEYCHFVDALGRCQAVEAERIDETEYGGRTRQETLTWRQRFAEARSPQAGVGTCSEPSGRVRIRPKGDLPVGSGWSLVVLKGLDGIDSPHPLARNTACELGDRQPFAFKNGDAFFVRGGPRTIVLNFSKGLAPDLSDEEIAKHVLIQPNASGLTWLKDYGRLRIQGDFEVGRIYRIEIHPGLLCSEGLGLEQAANLAVRFNHLDPRLLLSTFTSQQMAAGRRRFDLSSVNVSTARLRGKKIPPASLPATLARYRTEYYHHTPDTDEWHAPLDFETIPGSIVFDRTLGLRRDPDAVQTTPLSWDRLVGASGRGAFFLDAASTATLQPDAPKNGCQTIVQLTDIGALWKGGTDRALLHAFSYATGAPLEGVAVHLVADDGRPLARHVTPGSGTVAFDLGTEPEWLLLTKGSDVHALRWASDTLPTHRFDLPHPFECYDPEPDKASRAIGIPKLSVLAFTDRDVYRPGELCHFKAIVRAHGTEGWELPQGLRANLEVVGPRGNRISSQPVELSRDGSLDADITLAGESLGRANIRLLINGDKPVGGTSVSIEDFEPDDFKVDLQTTGEDPDAPFSAEVSADYLLGKPLSRSDAIWSLSAWDAGFIPDGIGGFVFCNHIDETELGFSNGSVSLTGKCTLSAAGEATIVPEIPKQSGPPQPRRITFSAEVTDINQKTVTASSRTVRHSSDFYLGIAEGKPFYIEGDLIPLTLVAVASDGRPFPETVQARITLNLVKETTVRVETAGGGQSYRSHRTLVPVQDATLAVPPMRRFGERWLADEIPGAPLPVFRPAAAGEYVVVARAKDPKGREVVTTKGFWVHGAGAWAWRDRPRQFLELTADRLRYQAGDTARVLIRGPKSGRVLISLERQDVRRTVETRIEDHSAIVEIPLAAADAPNVYVSAVLLRGAKGSPQEFPEPEFAYGYCELRVDDPSRSIGLEASVERESYVPGETVRVSVEARDKRGGAVADAEVTLYAIDEGVALLTGYRNPDPARHFEVRHALGVRSHVSIESLLVEDPARREYDNKGFIIGGGGDEMSGRPREVFVPCAYWNARLRTDPEGRVRAEFAAPSATSRFRVIAVAHTRRHQFASAQAAFATQKPITIQPSPPRFARVDDDLQIRAIVHNLSGQNGRAKVSLRHGDRASEREIDLAAGRTTPIDFSVKFGKAGKIPLVWRASLATDAGKSFTDSVQIELPVEHAMPALREVHLHATREASVSLLKDANPALLEGNGTVSCRIANTRLMNAHQAVNYLLDYPYGCTEQISSILLPWIVMDEFRSVFPDLGPSREDAGRVVARSIGRLLDRQADDGGLRYWQGMGQSSLWPSAYAAVVLALAQRHDFDVPKPSFQTLLNYLSRELRNASAYEDDYRLGPRCLALYALALAKRPEPAYATLMLGKREHLSYESRLMLALAMLEAGGAPDTVSGLIDEGGRDDMSLWFGSPVRILALEVMTLTKTGFDPERLNRQLANLLESRRAGHWGNTQANAWAIAALGAYASRFEESVPGLKGTLARGEQTWDFDFPERFASATYTLDHTPDLHGTPMTLSNPLARLLYADVTIEAHPPATTSKPQDRGFSIARAYSKIGDDESLAPANDLRAGDRILVELTLEVHRTAHFVAIDDALPAIFEAVNPRFQTRRGAGAGLATDFVSDHSELRTSRAVFFCDHLRPGRYVMRYLARVRCAGTAFAPPCKVEEMYHPDRFGLSAAAYISAIPFDPGT